MIQEDQNVQNQQINQQTQQKIKSLSQNNHQYQPLQQYPMPPRHIFPSSYSQFQHQYLMSLQKLPSITSQKIQQFSFIRQQKVYFLHTSVSQYKNYIKSLKLTYLLEYPHKNNILLLKQAMSKRQQNIQKQINQGKIQIIKQKNQRKSSKQQEKHDQALYLQSYKPQIDTQQQRQQAIKRYKKILQKQKQQKRRLQQLKKKQLQHKFQLQQKQQTQHQKHQQQLKKHHSQYISQKIKKSLQQRQKQSILRLQRQKQLKYLLKSFNSSLSLHQKLQKQFHQQYHQRFQQQKQKVKKEKLKKLYNVKIQQMNLKEHQEKYLKWKNQAEAIRAAKMEQYQRMIQMHEEEIQRKFIAGKKNRYGSRSYDQNNNDGDQQQQQQPTSSRYLSFLHPVYIDPSIQSRQLASQKRKKMSLYYQQFIKSNFKPKISIKKQQQLKQLIQNLQFNKKMKKVKNEKGQIVYEQIKVIDPNMKGIQYLEHSREIGRLRKVNRQMGKQKGDINNNNQHNDIKRSSINNNPAQPQKLDYLKTLRQQRTSSNPISPSPYKRSLSFLQKNSIPFITKLQKVQKQSFKLQQNTILSQEQLKYGKFKTSEEILNYKEQIDNNHIEVLRMKLKLISQGN